MSVTGDYSEVADAQLDALETAADPALYNAVLDAIDLILNPWTDVGEVRRG